MKTLIITIALLLATNAVAANPLVKFTTSVVKTSDSGKANALKAVFGGGR